MTGPAIDLRILANLQRLKDAGAPDDALEAYLAEQPKKDTRSLASRAAERRRLNANEMEQAQAETPGIVTPALGGLAALLRDVPGGEAVQAGARSLVSPLLGRGRQSYTDALADIRGAEGDATTAGRVIPRLIGGGAAIAAIPGSAMLSGARYGVASGLLGADPASLEERLHSAAKQGTVGAIAGKAGQMVGGGISRVLDAIRPSRAIVREAATQLPANAAATLARQEAMAPGSAVLADVSPEMQALTRGVGADASTGVAARLAAEARTDLLKVAKGELGKRYDALNRPVPIDATLRDALKAAGKKGILPKDARGATMRPSEPRPIHEGTGLPLNDDGTVTLYHHTSAKSAASIRATGELKSAGEPDVYFTTRKEVDTGYGDSAVPIRVDPKKLLLDDEFPGGRKDFRLPIRKGQAKVVVEAEPAPVASPVADVELSAVLKARSQLLAEARATRNSSTALDKNRQAKALTQWAEQHAQDLTKVDADYAFLLKRAGMAKKTLQEVTESSKNYAANRAYGSEAGSIGGSLPSGSRGFADLLAGLVKPNRGARAKAVNELLLTPGEPMADALKRIMAQRSPSAVRSLLATMPVASTGLLDQ